MCRVTLRCQGYFCHVWPLEKLCVHGRVIMNYVSAVAAARTTRTKSCWHGAVRHVCQEDKVRTLLRRTARADAVLARVPPCSLMSAWLPNPHSHFCDYHTRTTGSLERRAPLRPPTWQDASFSRRRRMYSESGGTRVPRRAPVVLWSYRPLAGVVRGCARPVQRSVVYVQ